MRVIVGLASLRLCLLSAHAEPAASDCAAAGRPDACGEAELVEASADAADDEAVGLTVALLQHKRPGGAALAGDAATEREEAPESRGAAEAELGREAVDLEGGARSELSNLTLAAGEGTEFGGSLTWHGVAACKKACDEQARCAYIVICGSQCHLQDEALAAKAGTDDPSCWAFLQEKAGSCKEYECAKEYVKGHTCQCSKECEKYKNCCADYHEACLAPTPPPEPTPAPTPRPPRADGAPDVFGHPSADVDYPEYEGFTLWLAEEFDEPLDLDTDPIWTWSDGGLTEGQVRFAKEAIRFEDGAMKIHATRGNPRNATACSHAEVGYVGWKSLTSGEFRSKYNMFRYGRYEVRMKAPSVREGRPEINGNFISTMFVYRDAKFKHWREIDIEISAEVTGDHVHAVTTNVLNANYRSSWSPGIQSSTHGYIKSINNRANFHVYAFEWLPTSVTWYVDGKRIRRFTSGWLKVPDLSTKIMMNLWIFRQGYGFGGRQGYNNRYPMYNTYDYFRFYKWDKETEYPCPNMEPTCLTEDDKYMAGNNPRDGIEQAGYLGNHRKPCV